MDSAPCSTCSLLELEHLPPNIQSECPPTMPSKIDPMGGKGDHMLSRMFNSTPTLFGSYPTRITSNLQSPVISFESHFPQINKNRSNEVFLAPNHTHVTHGSCSSTLARTNDVRELGNSKVDTKVVGIEEQAIRGIEVTVEGEEVTEVPYSHLHPNPLTSVQTRATEGLVAMPARASSSSTTLQPLSPVSWSSSANSQPSSPALQPSSTAMRPSSMASKPTSTT